MDTRSISRFRPLAAALIAALLSSGCIDDSDEDTPEDATNSASDPEPDPVNRAPAISGALPDEVVVGSGLRFRPVANDPDGDPLSFSIVNKPTWTEFDTSTGELSGTPRENDVGEFDAVSIYVSDGRQTRGIGPFKIRVRGNNSSNNAPTISGTPSTAVEAGSPYLFAPIASDSDNDRLEYSIANKPVWLDFNTSSGRLQGTPGTQDVGIFRNIRISVSDGSATASLSSFDLTVTMPASNNRAPTIDGTPAPEVTVNNLYSFQPTASDPDGDSLTFAIANQPPWAQFDAMTGRLSGTPGQADIGTYRNVQVSVSDGSASTSLAPFDITVAETATGSITLSWTPPSENSDGSALTDLAGYRLHYGSSSGTYTSTIALDDPGVTTYVIENLVVGRYYLAATSVNSAGVESVYSGEVSIDVMAN